MDGLVGEQIGAVPVPQIWEPIVEGPLLVPRERVQNRTPEQIVDVSVPPVMEDGLHLVPQERVLNRTREQLVDVPVPQFMEAAVENRVGEQIVDSLVPPIMEAVLPSAPQERVQNLTQELVQNCVSTEEIGDGVQQVPSKRMPERHGDGNIKGLDQYNMPCAGVVSAGFVRVADVFRPLPQGPKRVFVDSGAYTGSVFLWRCLISMSTRLSLATSWSPTSRVWTSTICLVLEMSCTSHGGASSSDYRGTRGEA